MSYATATITILTQMIWGAQRVHLIKIDASTYQVDGIQVAAADCGLAILTALIPFFVGAGAVSAGPVSAWWDNTNNVVHLLQASNSEVTGGTTITTAGYVYALAIGQ